MKGEAITLALTLKEAHPLWPLHGSVAAVAVLLSLVVVVGGGGLFATTPDQALRWASRGDVSSRTRTTSPPLEYGASSQSENSGAKQWL